MALNFHFYNKSSSFITADYYRIIKIDHIWSDNFDCGQTWVESTDSKVTTKKELNYWQSSQRCQKGSQKNQSWSPWSQLWFVSIMSKLSLIKKLCWNKPKLASRRSTLVFLASFLATLRTLSIIELLLSCDLWVSTFNSSLSAVEVVRSDMVYFYNSIIISRNKTWWSVKNQTNVVKKYFNFHIYKKIILLILNEINYT